MGREGQTVGKGPVGGRSVAEDVEKEAFVRLNAGVQDLLSGFVCVCGSEGEHTHTHTHTHTHREREVERETREREAMGRSECTHLVLLVLGTHAHQKPGDLAEDALRRGQLSREQR